MIQIPDILTRPEFYDVFGLPVFTFMTILAIWMLWTNKKPNKVTIWLLLAAGVAGLIVDGTILALTRGIR